MELDRWGCGGDLRGGEGGKTMIIITYCMKKIASIKNKCLVLTELCKILVVNLKCRASNRFAYIDFNQKLLYLILRELNRKEQNKGVQRLNIK